MEVFGGFLLVRSPLVRTKGFQIIYPVSEGISRNGKQKLRSVTVDGL